LNAWKKVLEEEMNQIQSSVETMKVEKEVWMKASITHGATAQELQEVKEQLSQTKKDVESKQNYLHKLSHHL
jgi:hypothetical protein